MRSISSKDESILSTIQTEPHKMKDFLWNVPLIWLLFCPKVILQGRAFTTRLRGKVMPGQWRAWLTETYWEHMGTYQKSNSRGWVRPIKIERYGTKLCVSNLSTHVMYISVFMSGSVLIQTCCQPFQSHQGFTSGLWKLRHGLLAILSLFCFEPSCSPWFSLCVPTHVFSVYLPWTKTKHATK